MKTNEITTTKVELTENELRTALHEFQIDCITDTFDADFMRDAIIKLSCSERKDISMNDLLFEAGVCCLSPDYDLINTFKECPYIVPSFARILDTCHLPNGGGTEHRVEITVTMNDGSVEEFDQDELDY